MKILELNFSGEWRGGERQTLLNMQGLQKINQQVFLLCRKNSSLHLKAKQENFTVYGLKNIIGVIGFLIIRARHFDILHAQTAHILTYCVVTKPFHRKKIVYTRRVNFQQFGFFTKLKYRFTNKIVGISTAAQQTLIRFTQRKDVMKISDIAVKETEWENLTEEIAKLNPGNKKIVGIVAALTYEKQPFVCLSAMKLLHQKNNNFICLHFGSGTLFKEMQEKILANGMEKYYILMGFQQNILSWFKYFDVLLMTSLNEGLGSSILDAYLNKVPVVSGTSGGLADIVTAEKAMVCTSGAPEEYCEKTETLLSSPELAGVLTAKAYNFVVKNHSMAYITKQYDQLFKELIQ